MTVVKGVTRVALADSNVLFRCGISRLLETQPDLEVAVECDNPDGAVLQLKAAAVDVLLVDVEYAEHSGPALVRKLAKQLPNVKIVVLTDEADAGTLLGCIMAGASGYLLKSITPDELFARLRGLREGEAAIALTTVSSLMERLTQSRCTLCLRASSNPALTPREREVLVLVARGMTNKRISEIMDISEYTVRNHLSSIYEKLNLDNRLQVAVYGVSHGLVDLGKGGR